LLFIVDLRTEISFNPRHLRSQAPLFLMVYLEERLGQCRVVILQFHLEVRKLTVGLCLHFSSAGEDVCLAVLGL
jgi:hypothetical protein